MSDEHNIHEPNDRFSDYMRERLSGYPTPLDDHCWGEIAARIEKKRGPVPVWRAHMIAIAAAAALLFVVFFLYNRLAKEDLSMQKPMATQNLDTAGKKMTHPEETDTEEAPKVEERKRAPALKKRLSESLSDEKSEKATAEGIESEGEKTPSEPGAEGEAARVEKETPDIEEGKTDEPKVEIFPEVKKHASRHMEHLMASNDEYGRRAKKKDGWQLVAAFGSAGGSSLFRNDTRHDFMNDGSPSFDKDSEIPDDNKFLDGNIPKEEIAEMKHAVPLSIGITIRKKLNKTLGVETGLMYTYLSTDFELRQKSSRDVTLILHYIGIPVHLIVNMWDNGAWNVYAAGGGMVEKGLQSVYTQPDFYRSGGTDYKKKNSISGLQWSLSGGIGISYRLYKGINLFAEPGFSYYFDCNQPISRRTEDPFNFNLHLGLRYDF